ncbi:MAG: crotonase/enoyl-CoA hydratase family protein [Myxococcota bacterium]
MTVRIEKSDAVTTVILSRPEVRNAVDRETADALTDAFTKFDADASADVAVLWGEGGDFCAGADLKAAVAGNPNRLDEDGDGPLGPTRLQLAKPVIAAVAGHAVAGGLELALWCDIRVAEENAVFGVFCRRWGVPLLDGGTVRLPRIIGQGRALDLILTGRGIGADEALQFGLVNRVVPTGKCRSVAEELAREIAAFPQVCVRADRRSVYEQFGLPVGAALKNEHRCGMTAIEAGESLAGAERFAGGAGRHGVVVNRR